MTISSEQVTENFTLQNVRRSGTEVQSIVVVVSEVRRGVGGRNLDHACFLGHLVDELERHTRRSCTNNGGDVFVQQTRNFSLVGLVVGVTGVSEDNFQVDSSVSSVNVCLCQKHTSFFGGSEECEVTGDGQSRTDLESQRLNSCRRSVVFCRGCGLIVSGCTAAEH